MLIVTTPASLSSVREPECVHRLAHPFADDQRSLERLLGQQHEQLLAAVAVDGVAGAALAHERVGDRAQDVVSGLVALAVVERLEVIEVAEQHAVGVAVADPARVVRREVLLEAQPVPEPGEWIAASLLGERRVEALELALDPAALGDVAEDDQRSRGRVALADRGRRVFDGEAGPVAAPEDLVGDGARDAVLETAGARAVLERVGSPVLARVVDEVVVAPPERLLDLIAGQRGRGGVDERDASLQVEPVDPVGGGVEQRLVLPVGQLEPPAGPAPGR